MSDVSPRWRIVATCKKSQCGEGALRSLKQGADTRKNTARGKLFQGQQR